MSSRGLSALLARTLPSSVVVSPRDGGLTPLPRSLFTPQVSLLSPGLTPLPRSHSSPQVSLHSPGLSSLPRSHSSPQVSLHSPGLLTRGDTASRSVSPRLLSVTARCFPPVRPRSSVSVSSVALSRVTEEIFIFFLPFVQKVGEVTGRTSPPRGQRFKLHKQDA